MSVSPCSSFSFGTELLVSDACCIGQSGSITVDPHDAVSWMPLKVADPSCPWACKNGPNMPKSIPFKDIVGAVSDSNDGSLRIWYCEAMHSKGPGGMDKVVYKLKKSDKLECSNRHEAVILANSIQKNASWWGRSHPPNLVLVYNPTSGKARSSQIVTETLVPMLRDAAGMHVTLHETQSPGHATSVISGLDLEHVDMLVFVGGDGTVFEGLQGLLNRSDWDSARRIPFTHVPGGSGNGLASSCGLWDPVTAAFSVCKGRYEPLDIASVVISKAEDQVNGNHATTLAGSRKGNASNGLAQRQHVNPVVTGQCSSRCFSFLSVVFGLWANIDVGTEAQRWMGESRYTIKAVQEAWRSKPYPVRISYWPADQELPTAKAAPVPDPQPPTAQSGAVCQALSLDASSRTGQHEALAEAVTVSRRRDNAGTKGVSASVSVSEHMLKEALLPKEGCSASDMGRAGQQDHAGTADSLSNVPCSHNMTSMATHSSFKDNAHARPGASPIPTPLLDTSWPDGPPPSLPAHESGMPRGWRMLPTTDLQMMALYNVPFMASHAMLNPRGSLSSGSFDLLYMHGLTGVQGRLQFGDMLLRSEDGGHVDLNYVFSEKVTGMALEPLCEDTFMVVDGEVVPKRTLYVEVHPSFCRTGKKSIEKLHFVKVSKRSSISAPLVFIFIIAHF
ncbi:hypothetical protein CEUSTIGMA_g10433.t1 [Chlamydomonas eustigma]|uniref:DAGKc domain-containing protein n=1 Tax=Chlamydomonas eustigma TaxID=1157962 RepID=A0A250XJ11_9CHLO|nr:hypothetical protein CEUSTIGMA_g10433.t1 [Chlamydomonas eustigma]|eukprot:GAX83006.1 hypothetical protein CEUSTIGMA_g10433.t1 [Chlamydomonas eustigma]